MGRRESRIIPARAGFTRSPTTRRSAAQDHPRSRGVYGRAREMLIHDRGSSPLARGLRSSGSAHWRSARIIPARAGFTAHAGMVPVAAGGSSPLARGLRGDLDLVHGRIRIIPARAGFTISLPLSAWVRWDHPRSRGVYGSPRTGMRPCRRIIPARAGFTPARPGPAPAASDHPRSRGVYSQAAVSATTTPGSSPLARGLRRSPRARRRPPGIIPARAGFTTALSWSAHRVTDHPRSRGVYQSHSAQPVISVGSSPLARGLPSKSVMRSFRDRIIPARAGFTRPDGPSRTAKKDHPRSRGVYSILSRPGLRISGSSPLARGLHCFDGDPLSLDRIIPARAGFTAYNIAGNNIATDHPRSRGVYLCCGQPGNRIAGSSPLARGLPWWSSGLLSRVRIIPARAGFTRARARNRRSGRDHPRSRGVYASTASYCHT